MTFNMKYKFPNSQKLEYQLRDAEVAMHRAVATEQDPQEVDRLRTKYLTIYHRKTKRDELYSRDNLPSQ